MAAAAIEAGLLLPTASTSGGVIAKRKDYKTSFENIEADGSMWPPAINQIESHPYYPQNDLIEHSYTGICCPWGSRWNEGQVEGTWRETDRICSNPQSIETFEQNTGSDSLTMVSTKKLRNSAQDM